MFNRNFLWLNTFQNHLLFVSFRDIKWMLMNSALIRPTKVADDFTH